MAIRHAVTHNCYCHHADPSTNTGLPHVCTVRTVWKVSMWDIGACLLDDRLFAWIQDQCSLAILNCRLSGWPELNAARSLSVPTPTFHDVWTLSLPTHQYPIPRPCSWMRVHVSTGSFPHAYAFSHTNLVGSIADARPRTAEGRAQLLTTAWCERDSAGFLDDKIARQL